MMEMSTIPSFGCELCHKSFSQKSSRNRHVREQHLHPGLYKCRKCGLRFSKKYNLQMHFKHVHSKISKTNAKQLQCSHCKGIFTNLSSLTRHIKDQHESVERNESSNTDLEVYKEEEDAQTLAESVLKELKQLQKDILAIEEQSDTSPNNTQEQTFIETTTVEDITIRDNLYPLGYFKLLKVQAVKRVDGFMYFICEFCSNEFRKTYNFLRHLRIHTKIRPFICVLCKKSFPTTAQLKTHCSRHKLHESLGVFHKLYKCPKCKEGFSAIQQLDKHLSSSLTCCNVTFKCPDCLKSFKTLKTILSHRHSKNDKEIDLLKKILPSPEPLEDKQNFFDCNLCGLHLNDRTLLKQHEKRHESLYKYQCTECQHTFASQSALKIHTKVHLKSRNFKCHYCYKTFKTAPDCRSHMMSHLKQLIKDQNDSLAIYPTFIENQQNGQIELIKTNKKYSLTSTQNGIASDLLKHKCSKCDKSFRFKAWLKKHFKSKHTSNRPYECQQCLRKFRTKQTLQTHLLIHSSKRVKFTCQVCARQYASSKSLKLHLRIHTQEKPFECNKCSKTFRTSGHLIQHRKSNYKE